MSRLLMLSHRKWFIDLNLINFVFYQPVCSQGQHHQSIHCLNLSPPVVIRCYQCLLSAYSLHFSLDQLMTFCVFIGTGSDKAY